MLHPHGLVARFAPLLPIGLHGLLKVCLLLNPPNPMQPADPSDRILHMTHHTALRAHKRWDNRPPTELFVVEEHVDPLGMLTTW